ncbi:MAG: hypothetical protein IKV77_02360 [Alistipes sp.]|nr:hypothetical protein [Alistipes sp.]
MTTYVYFIGGTGARVLRSLTMLLASGVSLGANNKIVPIILDYDSDNGDLELSTSLLRSYNKMHTYAEYNLNEDGFFCAPIEVKEKLSRVDLKVQGNKKTFAQYVEYAAIKDDFAKKFLKTLYDDSVVDDGKENPCAELHLNLEKGFKGNPNIGSVVFNDYFKTDEYRTFENDFNQDRIFIVGSIFGGTGSSGLPQLVKWFRQSSHKESLKNAPIGACVVLPYFKVKKDENSAINSETFNSKTKAALTFYSTEINNLINEIYYIGHDSANARESYSNHEGSKEQKNEAHLVELLSAMSIVEFVKRPQDAPSMQKDAHQSYEYTTSTGIKIEKRKNDDSKEEEFVGLKSVSYLDLLGVSEKNNAFNPVYDNYVCKLNAFAFFSEYYKSYTYKNNDSGTWGLGKQDYLKTLGSQITQNTTFGEDLMSFLKAFEVWVKELEQNGQLEFKPYTFEKELEYVLNIADSDTKIQGIKNLMTGELNAELKQWKNSKIDEKQYPKAFIRMGTKAGMAAATKKDK